MLLFNQTSLPHGDNGKQYSDLQFSF